MKTAIITGASSGIGAASAKALSKQNFNLLLLSRNEENLKKVRDSIDKEGGTAYIACADVTDKAAVKQAARNALDQFGSIDLLVNNAGIMPLSLMKNLHEDEWDRMIDVNIKGVLNGISAVLPTMLKQQSGHIINISSIAALSVFPSGAVYCATKYAVDVITEGLRQELSQLANIRTTSIRPGYTATNLFTTITDQELLQRLGGAMQEITPLSADEIANAVVYAATQPDYVNVNGVTVRPTSQS